MRRIPSLAVIALSLTACGFGVSTSGTGATGTGGIGSSGIGSSSSGSSSGSSGTSGADPYQQLETQLEQGRTQFLPTSAGATELASAGNALFWLEFPGYDPTLHSYDETSGLQIDYTFSIGTGDDYNFQASEALVVSAANDGNGNVIFSAYDATQPDLLIASTSVPAPTDEEKWWTYSVDGSTVYFATTGSGPAALYSWAPATNGAPTAIANLGSTVQALNALGVVGQQCGFIDLAGGVWLLQLPSGTPQFLNNADQADGFSLGTTGLLYTTDMDAFFYPFGAATSATVDIGAQLQASTAVLAAGYPGIQDYSTDATLFQNTVVYIGQSGLFQMDLSSGVVTPLLLNGDDGSVEYRYPMPLTDGSIYTVGLESTDGSTGADGPVFKVVAK